MKRKMKICHVTSVHKSTDVRIFEKECTSLAKKQQYEVFIVAKGQSFEKNKVHVIGAGDAPTGKLKRIFSFSRHVINLAVGIDADIYHLHDPELLQYVGELKKLGKIVIFDSHEDVSESILDKDYIPNGIRLVVAKLYKQYSSKQMRKCDALISVTPHIVKKLKDYNNRVAMITNYPLIKLSEETNSKITSSKSIVFAGGIVPQWQHEMVIKAIDSIDNISYELYGPANEEYLQKLKLLPGWKKTNYHGAVPFSIVQEALSDATISIALLKPSNNTAWNTGTLGNTKLFESLNAGLPIICTNFKLWKDIIEEYKCGICIQHDSVEELIEAIKQLIDNKGLCLSMGKNGQKAILEKYNWSTQEDKLYNLYNEIEYKMSSNQSL